MPTRLPHGDPCPPTLAAILTPLAEGGIAIVHVVGPRAFDLTRQLFRPNRGDPPRPDSRKLRYGHIVDDGQVVDEVLVRLVPPAESPAGQPLVEVSCHGGVLAVQRVLDGFVRRGARAVEPDVLLQGRDASRIRGEALRALLEAATPLAVDTLLDQLDGALERAVRDLPPRHPARLDDALAGLLATARLGQALWQPLRVALAGPTNAGKSTLFNALAREDRMIVSPAPGTTRDSVSAEVAIGGIPLWLTDTAGERQPGSVVERQAIERGRATAAEADLVILVLDASAPLPVPPARLAAADRRSRLVVLNKADLGLAPWARGLADALAVSARSGEGLDRLCRRLVHALVGEARYQPRRPVVFTHRQADLLRQARSAAHAGDLAQARERADRVVSG